MGGGGPRRRFSSGVGKLSMEQDKTDVLVVGAGPVGLYAALVLAQSGFKVRVIDRERRVTSRSYACALHPRTLHLLDTAGLAPELIPHGRRISRVAFYEGAERRAELNMSRVGGDFPFVLTISQAILEGTLERKLTQAGVRIQWDHRFDDLEQGADSVIVKVEKLGGTSTGYIVPHWETVVERSFELRTQFVIGTDGHNSLVRRRLGLDYQRLSALEHFGVYEFESDAPAEDEMRVVLGPTSTNVLWPLARNGQRWTFQLTRGDVSAEFPNKERRAARLQEATVDEQLKRHVENVASHRAPWFKNRVREITWCAEVPFERAVVEEFGRGRCWLAGDAAHQTGPVGAQSMNVGMHEAEGLARNIANILRGKAGMETLESYKEERQIEWQRLLGQKAVLRARNDTDSWVGERASRLLSCIPGSGAELSNLAEQIKLDFCGMAVAAGG